MERNSCRSLVKGGLLRCFAAVTVLFGLPSIKKLLGQLRHKWTAMAMKFQPD